MSFLDQLSQARDSQASIWHQFALAHSAGRDDWYVFFEGKLDMPFYLCALERSLPRDIRIVEFRCGGKRNVLSAREAVRGTHASCNRCLFFIDKDFSDVLNEPCFEGDDLFCTELYSIENYFVNEHALDLVWTHLWSLRSNDPRLVVIRERFNSAREHFYQRMTPMMAWIVLAKKRGLRVNVNNVNLSEFYILKDNIPRRLDRNSDRLRRVTSCDFKPNLCDWLAEARRLRALEAQAVIRGKFDLWFFCKFLEGAFATVRDSGGEKPDGAIPRTPESVSRALIGKLTVPEKLRMFLATAISLAGSKHCTGGA